MEPETSLIEYLDRLVEDPKALRAFRRDSKKAVAAAGLSSKDARVLLSGDPKLIKQALSDMDERALGWVIVIP